MWAETAPSCFTPTTSNSVRSKLNQCSQTGHPAIWWEGLPQSPGAHRCARVCMGDTYVYTHMVPLPCCYAHRGEEMGTHTQRRSQGLARLHSHLLQKQKWQPQRQGCDSSLGETAPAIAAKTLAPTGVAVGPAQTQTSPLGACPAPYAQGSRTSQASGHCQGGRGPRMMKRRPRGLWGVS